MEELFLDKSVRKQEDPLWLVSFFPSVEPDFGDDTAIVPDFKVAKTTGYNQTLPVVVSALSRLTLWVEAANKDDTTPGEEITFKLPIGSEGKTVRVIYRFIQSIQITKTLWITEYLISPSTHKAIRNSIANYVRSQRFFKPLGPDQEQQRQHARLHAWRVMQHSPWQCLAVSPDNKTGFKPLKLILRKCQRPIEGHWKIALENFIPDNDGMRQLNKKCLCGGFTVVICGEYEFSENYNNLKKESPINRRWWTVFSLPQDNSLLNQFIAKEASDESRGSLGRITHWFECKMSTVPKNSKTALLVDDELDDAAKMVLQQTSHLLWFRQISPLHGIKTDVTEGENGPRQPNAKRAVKVFKCAQDMNISMDIPISWPSSYERRRQVRVTLNLTCHIWLGKITKADALLVDFSMNGCQIRFHQKTKLRRLHKYLLLTVPGTAIKRCKYKIVAVDASRFIGHFVLEDMSIAQHVSKPFVDLQYKQHGIKSSSDCTNQPAQRALSKALIQLGGQLHPGAIISVDGIMNEPLSIEEHAMDIRGSKSDAVFSTLRKTTEHLLAHHSLALSSRTENGKVPVLRHNRFSLRALFEPDSNINTEIETLLRNVETRATHVWQSMSELLVNEFTSF